MQRIVFVLTALFAAAFCARAASPFEKWEPEIQKFEARDREQMPPKDAILFVGSSSIRLWTNLAETFPRRPIIRRGFGGSTTADLLHFADRIVLPYKPKKIFIYEGDNDIAAGKSPEAVFADFKALYEKIHRALPGAKVHFIAIKPSPKRWHLAPQARAANEMVRKFAQWRPSLVYVDIWEPMLGPDGAPRRELFVADDLHLNGKGYEVWAKVIARRF